MAKGIYGNGFKILEMVLKYLEMVLNLGSSSKILEMVLKCWKWFKMFEMVSNVGIDSKFWKWFKIVEMVENCGKDFKSWK